MRFYLFDKIIHYIQGEEATGIKNISLQEDFLINHYDRYPVMPAPLIIESLAQLGGWTITVSSDYKYLAVMVMVKNITISGDAVPGDQIVLHTSIEDVNEYAGRVTCRAEIDGTQIVKVGNITYVLYQIPEKDRESIKERYSRFNL